MNHPWIIRLLLKKKTDLTSPAVFRRRSSCLLSSLVLALLALCLFAILVGSFFLLPDYASERFGPSSPDMSPVERVYRSALLLLQANTLTLPADPYGTPQPFQVALGEAPGSVASRLEQSGLIPDAQAFRNYLIYSGLDTSLQAGEFSLSPALTPVEIAQSLQDSTPTEVTFQILPGWRREEIAALLPTSGLDISPQEFLDYTASIPPDYEFLQAAPETASLEGFLFPAEYRLSRTLDVTGLTDVLLSTFEAQVSEDIRAGFAQQGLSLYQAVSLASMVQREAVDSAEMPLIASVFLNRLQAGLNLDSDPTIQYALGYNHTQNSWWTNPLTLEQLQLDSPYNTYLYPGLPPGPIASPGLSALKAVAFPANTPYYYFRAACDGSGKHNFSQTYDEHLSKGCNR